MKERLGMTQLRAQANQMKFGEVRILKYNLFYFLFFILRLKKMLIKMLLDFQQV